VSDVSLSMSEDEDTTLNTVADSVLNLIYFTFSPISAGSQF
jgi:hypothetical protein